MLKDQDDRRSRRIGVRVALASSLGSLVFAGAAMAASGGPVGGFGKAGLVAASTGAQTFGVAAQPDGSSVLAGERDGHVYAERLSASGSVLDTYTGAAGSARAAAYDPVDGDTVIAGTANGAMFVERLSPTLTPDTSFGTGGADVVFPGTMAQADAVGVSSSGQVVIAGFTGGNAAVSAAASFSSSGKLAWSHTYTFQAISRFLGLAIQSNGAIVAVGNERQTQIQSALVARLTSSGALDHSFHGTGAFAYVYPTSGATSFNAVTLDGGTIIVAGDADAGPTTLVASVSSGGNLNGGFGSGGIATAPAGEYVTEDQFAIGAYGVAVAKGGVIVAAGSYEDTGARFNEALYAFTSGGSRDSGFGSGGVEQSPVDDYEACAVSVLPDGNLVTAGDSTGLPDTAPCTQRTYSAGFAAEYGGFGSISFPSPTLKASLSGLAGSYKKTTAHKSGVRFTLTCSLACKAAVTVTHGSKKIETTSATLTSAGKKTITLSSSTFKKTVDGKGTIKLGLSVVVTSTLTGKTTTIKKTLTFH